MKVENPVALRFILQDEIYLLNNDKALYSDKAPQPIEETPAPPIVVETPPLNFNYMGGHKKNFLVIVHYPGLEFIEDKHLTALQNILKRLEFEMDDVAIFNLAGYSDATFDVLAGFFKPQKLLLLGQNALPAGIGVLTLNKAAQLNNCPTLYSFSFDEMMDSNDNKKAFWEQMKQL
jgi:hypothetical protein